MDLDNRPVDLVAEGYDIGIRGGVIEDSSLIARRVCALPMVLVASPGYLRRAGVPAAPDDLRTHRCAGVRFTSGQAVAPDLQCTVAQVLAANPAWVATGTQTGRRSATGKH